MRPDRVRNSVSYLFTFIKLSTVCLFLQAADGLAALQLLEPARLQGGGVLAGQGARQDRRSAHEGW